MASFSDLPNELVIDIWGYMLEPEDVESFALVSKRVYSVSTPFVMEHRRLKHQFSSLLISRDGRQMELLEQILRNPRIALYTRHLQVQDWTHEPDSYMVELTSPKDTMAVVEKAIRHSKFVTPSEVEDWFRDVQRGSKDPILALTVMRLTKLRTLTFSALYSGVDEYLLRTLDRILHFSEASIHSEPSIPGTEIDGRSRLIFSKPSILFNVRNIQMSDYDTDLNTLSRLLRNIKGLTSFSYFGDAGYDTQIFQVHNELLKYSKGSLQRLILYNNGSEQNTKVDITCFEQLEELGTDLVTLLGHDNESRRNLADVLPVSIKEVDLRSWEPFHCEPFHSEPFRVEILPIDLIRRLVLQIIECKTKRLPNLKALRFEASFLETGMEEELPKLKEQCAEIGVFLEVYNT